MRFVFDHHESGCDASTVGDDEPARRQPAGDAWRVFRTIRRLSSATAELATTRWRLLRPRAARKKPRSRRGFFLVIAGGAGPRAAELGVARSAQTGLAVRISVRGALVP